MNNSIKILTSIFNDLKKYSGNNFIIQCTGSILQDNDLLRSFAEDIVALQNSGINIIVIHDGSNVVNQMMDKFTLKGATDNIRVTDQVTAEIVEMILSGHVNKKIVSQINQASGYAAGISGKDSQFLLAKRATIARHDFGLNDSAMNFGFLGDLSLINPDILFLFEDQDIIPIISPIALGEDGKTYKLDPSDISGAIAAILGAKKLFFISDDPGILDTENETLYEINPDQANKILSKEKENSPLASNIRAGLMALENNSEEIHIIDGRIPHCLLRELFTDELVGTTIKA
ncbi:MAG: acetylglutamate kinase [Pseudomonadota bacterium]